MFKMIFGIGAIGTLLYLVFSQALHFTTIGQMLAWFVVCFLTGAGAVTWGDHLDR